MMPLVALVPCRIGHVHYSRGQVVTQRDAQDDPDAISHLRDNRTLVNVDTETAATCSALARDHAAANETAMQNVLAERGFIKLKPYTCNDGGVVMTYEVL